jgi:hypothetical protein
MASTLQLVREHEEVEVTKEMIAAGSAAYYDSDRRFDSDDEIVTRIYRRMALAQRSSDPVSGPVC